MRNTTESRWEFDGVRVVHADELDSNTPQTAGMLRQAAITARAGAQKLWAGTMLVQASARTGPHHHGDLETILYVVRGRAKMVWGDTLQYVAEAGPGDFIFVPPYVPHQEINPSGNDELECIVVRSGQAAVVVNLDIVPAETPAEVQWVDDIHREHP
jgi:uncharacterized RmlC-like cupin family protein